MFRFIGRWWSTVFALDYRSLAAFRIGLGGILLADLILRLPTVPYMYTDDGVLPRSLMREVWSAFDAVGLQQWGVGSWSLHAISGDVRWQYFLFAASSFFAFLMLVGSWTRTATVASFVLLVSAHNRIPFVLTSGDTHLRIVMFWAMFLPLGKLWSVDAARAARAGVFPDSNAYVSAATAGLIVQLFILYFFSGLAKWNAAWWEGNGVFLAIGLTIYNTEWSQSFLHFPTLCRVFSIATVVSEVFLPWLMFVPWKNGWWRMLNLAIFVAMHIGILLILSIGLFPYICIVIWLVAVPSGFWEWLGVRLSGVWAGAVPDRPARPWRVFVQVFCGLMIPFMLVWNVINIRQDWIAPPIFDPVRTTIVRGFDESTNPIYRGYEIVGHALGVGQHFQMFGMPPTEDAWFVYRATLRNGEVRDIFLGGRDIPADGILSGRDSLPHHHWRQLHRNLTDGTAAFVRQRMAVFMVERWNQSHSADEQVESMRLEVYFDQFWPTPIPGEARGAMIWGTYPDGPSAPFESPLNRAMMGAGKQGF